MRRLVGLLVLCACSAPSGRQNATTPQTGDRVHTTRDDVDESHAPCEDFYQYACGNYAAREEQEEDAIRSRRTDAAMAMREKLRTAVESLPGTDPVAALYAACKGGTRQRRALQPFLDDLGPMRKRREVEQGIARLHGLGIGVPFAVSIQGHGDTKHKWLHPGGLGLGEAQHYGDNSLNGRALRLRYRKLIARGLTAIGEQPAAAERAAHDVVTLEQSLAKARTKTSSRDVDAGRGLPALSRAAPKFEWRKHLPALFPGGVDHTRIVAPRFLKRVDQLLDKTPPSVWRHYLQWHLVLALGADGPEEFQALEAERKRLLGQPLTSADDQCLSFVAGVRPSDTTKLLGQDGTRARHIAATLQRKNGAPLQVSLRPQQPDIDFKVSRDHVANWVEARRAFRRKARPNTPVLAIAAHLSVLTHQLYLPPALLSPPFVYDDAARTYGALGSVIGHHLANDTKERTPCGGTLTRAATIRGLHAAFVAMEAHADPDPEAFFVAFAHMHCTGVGARHGYATSQVARAREHVNGTVRHLRTFRETFSCEKNQRMASGDLCPM